jgi:putative FmdB family regulatory protein
MPGSRKAKLGPMPIYEYRCGACGHELEALQKLADGPLRKCPSCGKSQLRRLVSAPSFRLKGGGWYETDFKGNGEKKRNLVETAGGESSESVTSSADVAKDAGKDSSKDSGKDASKDSGKDSASKEATAKPANASSSGAADKKPKSESSDKPAPKKNARSTRGKKSARA